MGAKQSPRLGLGARPRRPRGPGEAGRAAPRHAAGLRPASWRPFPASSRLRCCWCPWAPDHVARISAWSSRAVIPCLCPDFPADTKTPVTGSGWPHHKSSRLQRPHFQIPPLPKVPGGRESGVTIQPSTVGALARYLPLFIKLLSISSGISVSALPEGNRHVTSRAPKWFNFTTGGCVPGSGSSQSPCAREPGSRGTGSQEESGAGMCVESRV